MSNPASEAARIMGQVRSAKKTAASRENGKLGGTHEMTDDLRQKIAEGQRRRWAERKAQQAQQEGKDNATV